MKKIVSILLAVMMIAAIAVPSFAATITIQYYCVLYRTNNKDIRKTDVLSFYIKYSVINYLKYFTPLSKICWSFAKGTFL